MKKQLITMSMITGMLINVLMVNAQVREIPLEDFFKNPEKSGYQISPNGKYFSYMAPYESRMNIFVQKIGKDKAEQLTFETDRDIAGYFWANDDRILYLKDDGGDENFSLFGVDRNGENLKCLTCFENVRTQIIDDLPEIEDYMIIGLNKRNPQVFDPYRMNVNTGEMEMIAENPGNIQGWVTDHDGKLRAAYAIVDGVNSQILYRETEEEEFEPILTTSFKETMSVMFFTFDNKNFYAVSNLGRDKTAAVIFDPRTAEEVEVLYENPDYDVSRLSYSRKNKELWAAYYTSWKGQRHYFSEDFKNLIENLESKLGDYEIGISAYDDDEETFIVRTSGDRTLGAYYLYDRKKDKLELIHNVGPWMKEDELAEMKPITYEARDGLKIHGYLTLPKGVEAKNLPVVVNVHGGPWARDSWGFNPEVQFLANRGYAVFQPNFRGSTGYGKEFWEASFKEWGLSMQNDVTDGTYWLIREGIADPGKIAIYGGSYGGYATLQGIVVNPTLYSAAVDYVGVSNLFTFMQTIPPYWKPLLDMMYEMVGNPEKDSVQFAATSPALNADKIMTPLFVAQGANDPRVNKAESDQIVEALRKRGIDVEYMVKDNEGHGFRNEENRFDFYRAMEKFLSGHIK
ncbi:MAG: S9 family peptidase [Bacteroidales bacterium]|nr:S9 family peptidase [Bacteroidales bacterium]MCF8387768.1 S9 family peptidase [Bacteroidales bacterium]MCF8399432.1 S9 family peptidase [Bacteroidales bacterium]